MVPENSLLLSSLSPDAASISKMMDLTLSWDKVEGINAPLSPLRSPVVADWKAVGSPIGPSPQADESLFEGLDGGSSLTSGQASETADNSPERQVNNRRRRPRAMSLIEKTVYGSGGKSALAEIDVERYRRAALSNGLYDEGSAERSRPPLASDQCAVHSQNGRCMNKPPDTAHPQSPNKLASNGASVEPQVAQLPQMLHEALGIENTEEATELIKSAVVGSEEASPAKPLGSMVSLFGSMPFGPAAMIFGGSLGSGHKREGDEEGETEGGEGEGEGEEVVAGEERVRELEKSCARDNEDRKGGDLSRRRSSLLNLLPDFDGFSVGSSELSIDDYFKSPEFAGPRYGEALCHELQRLCACRSKPIVRRHPRRHSIAATGLASDFDETFGSLSLASVEQPPTRLNHSGLSASAAAFQFQGFSPSSVGSASASTLLEMMSSGDFGLSSPSLARFQPPPSSAAATVVAAASMMKDISFQLSTYKGPLYAVEFKAGRTEIFYVLEIDGTPQLKVKVGDLVIVEADRGEDLGKVTIEISVDKLKQLMMPGPRGSPDKDSDILTPELAALVHSKEIVPKRIHRLAQPADLKLLQAKAQEEAIAMVRCQSRIRQKKLPMEVVDAEYQWDRNKLTFYFCADRRIDFRELVRDLFRIYKTRIWMCAVDKASPRMLMYSSPCGSTVTSLNGPMSDFNSHGDVFDEEELSGLPSF